ncbi:MAG: hypothetical protein SCALA701_06060 [Candidatus Scalindua sp.]|nr:MAG: hypothetical protein SCALA701_06060 [Candidatus Scalindua sp.]
MLLFYEAVVKIQENTVETETTRQIIYKAIRSSMRERDRYSDYLSPDEYAEYRRSQSEQYCGVGMDIFRDSSGRVVCIPYPDGPARKAGVEYGNTLTFVDDQSVEEKSIITVGYLIRGKIGTSVSLVFDDSQNATKQCSLLRRPIKFRSVSLHRSGHLLILKIFRFTRETTQEIRSILDILIPGTTMIVDLRGNTGGDLFEAVDAASLFLDRGSKVVGIKSNKGIKEYKSANVPLYPDSTLVLWQDGLTASAAEVFIAALVENNRAVSIGKTSFGKGVTQSIVELSDGSALFVTNGVLRTPNGNYFHTEGLEPNYPITTSSVFSEDEYETITLDIIESGEHE